MSIRRTAPPPQPCGCAEQIAGLQQVITGLEQDISALAAAVITLRPRRPVDSIEQGLIGWSVRPPDARRIAEIIGRAR